MALVWMALKLVTRLCVLEENVKDVQWQNVVSCCVSRAFTFALLQAVLISTRYYHAILVTSSSNIFSRVWLSVWWIWSAWLLTLDGGGDFWFCPGNCSKKLLYHHYPTNPFFHLRMVTRCNCCLLDFHLLQPLLSVRASGFPQKRLRPCSGVAACAQSLSDPFHHFRMERKFRGDKPAHNLVARDLTWTQQSSQTSLSSKWKWGNW